MVIAALMKAASPGDLSMLNDLLRLSPWMFHALLQAELAIGCFLLLGAVNRCSKLITFAVFSVFSLASLYSVVVGSGSCGCFGATQVDPRVTVLFDLSILAATLIPGSKLTKRHDLRMPALVYAATALPVGLWATQTLPETGLMVGEDTVGSSIMLTPTDWIGQDFPLSHLISPTVDTKDGQWTVLFYHHGCNKCRHKIEAFANLGKEEPQFLLIEVPPFSENPLPEDGNLKHSRLPNDRTWLINTPVTVSLDQGKVTAIE